jgi:ribosome recycling factor
MYNEVLTQAELKMQATADALGRDLAGIRTNRASPALVEHIKVDYAEAQFPIRQLAGISAAGAAQLVIQPWDPTSMKAIEKAILKSDLGLTPRIDGNLLRLNIPPLSQERRQELIKVTKRRVEEAKVSIRNERRDAAEVLKKLEKDGDISQDEHKRAMDRLQMLTDSFIDKTEKAREAKEQELLEV